MTARRTSHAGPVNWRRALLVCALAPLAAHALTPEELFRLASPSIWTVKAMDEGGRPLALGSAVVVGAGQLVTNCHVLRKASAVTVRRDRIQHAARLVHPDTARDLCLLEVTALSAPSVSVAPISDLRVGQKVFAIGSPAGLEQTISDGLVSALRRKGDALEYIQISAPISEGSSGGGLFDDNGNLVGITTATLGGSAQSINFARPAQWIEEIPARARAALAEHARTASTTTRPIAPPLQPMAATPTSVAASPVGAAAGKTAGVDTYNAERLAKSRECAALPRATLVAKGPGFETYSVACASGDALSIRCEFGNCRELR